MRLFSRPGKVALTRLEPGQASACAALHASAFAHPWSELEFERLIAADTNYADAALEGKTLMGFILSRVAADEAEVLTIVVGARWRGRGVGRALLERHLERLGTAGARTLFLEVNADNAPARALYARTGFAEVGRRKAYYAAPAGTPRADALILRRSLR